MAKNVPAEESPSHLKLQINSLRRELEFQQLNMSVLNRMNANARAWLRSQEIYYLVLTGVTSGAGLGLNRAMLFVTDAETMEMSGAMAISPDNEKQMHEIYEAAEELKFSFEFYIEQFYRNNYQVRNRLHNFVTKLRFPRGANNIITEVLTSRKARYVRKATPDDFRGLAGLGKKLPREFIIAPLTTAQEEIGVIIADNFYTRKGLTPQDAVALQNTCKFGATMIAGAREFERSEFHAQGDPLTQVYNFRYLRQVIAHEISRCDRYKRKLCIAFVEADNFSEFIMAHGHLSGNKALIDLAALIKSKIRRVDYIGRHIGARFVLLMPETEREGGEKALQKITRVVRETIFEGAAGKSRRRLSISTGLVCYPDDAADMAGLLDLAERNLLQAKS